MRRGARSSMTRRGFARLARLASMAPITLIVRLALVVLPAGLAAPAPGAPLDRGSDPVVMQGSELTDLAGLPPDDVVAFRYAGGWVQFPVQIDERFVNDFGVVYNIGPIGLTTLGYADAGTFMGPDPDPTFDGDDELVFMARDAGDAAPPGVPDPAGVVAGSRVDLLVIDPITSGSASVYLFESDGSLSPDAGMSYVTYTFVLLAGDYLTHYNTESGPNPEDSEAATAHYRTHFSDRWIRDRTHVLAESASGVDILDRHKNLFAPGICSRSEDTFSEGEGAFFANIDGPVRGIRSYLGANSGPLTQRDHFFYERRHDVVTRLRVHAISGMVGFYDYTPDATGMTYHNDLDPGGVTIDGAPEVVSPGALVWEMVTGAQGTLIHAHAVLTDIPGFGYTSYYEDDATSPATQCTGDPWAYGSSGVWIDRPIPNTDPALGEHNTLVSTRVVYAEGPHRPVALAERRYQQAIQPVLGTVTGPGAVLAEAAASVVRLARGRPSPFAARTRIDFVVPAGETATLGVYDVTGQLVRTLYQAAGSGARQTVTWDGRDARGRRVAAGVYVYRLRTPRRTAVQKTLVVK